MSVKNIRSNKICDHGRNSDFLSAKLTRSAFHGYVLNIQFSQAFFKEQNTIHNIACILERDRYSRGR